MFQLFFSLIELNKENYQIGEPIVAYFNAGPGNPKDWVGIYKAGDTPSAVWSTLWFYVNGSQSSGEAIADGSVTFPEGLAQEGFYWAGFFENDVYGLMDSVAFTVGDVSGVDADEAAFPQGKHFFVFDGVDLASGSYFCRLTAGQHTITNKMLLLK